MKVEVRRVLVNEGAGDLPGYERTGRYTDVLLRGDDGCAYYSRLPGWDCPTEPAWHAAQHEARGRRGFYRREG